MAYAYGSGSNSSDYVSTTYKSAGVNTYTTKFADYVKMYGAMILYMLTAAATDRV
jgi:hypothetical protein